MLTPATQEQVLSFWFGALDACGRADPTHRAYWQKQPDTLDEQIRLQFGALHTAALSGALEGFRDTPRGTLAYIVVLDQFSRFLYRGRAEQFAGDALALAAALSGHERGLASELALDERVVFYLPLVHSEQLGLHDQCLELLASYTRELMGSARASMLSRVGFVERQRDVVHKFGRYPQRNALLGRESTPEERAYLELPDLA